MPVPPACSSNQTYHYLVLPILLALNKHWLSTPKDGLGKAVCSKEHNFTYTPKCPQRQASVNGKLVSMSGGDRPSTLKKWKQQVESSASRWWRLRGMQKRQCRHNVGENDQLGGRQNTEASTQNHVSNT